MKLAYRALALFLCLLIPLSLFACGEEDARDTVAVTIVPQRALVHAVAGDLFRVVTLVPAGQSPETYEPTARTMMDLSDAAVWFSIGVPVEEASLIPSLPTGVRCVSLADAAAKVYPDLMADGGRDAHVWLSPRRVKVMVDEIAATLAALYPDHADTFLANAAAYCAEVDAADARIRTLLAESGMTEFIVYHPAFGYLADEYGLTMHALEKEGSEPTAQHLAEMAELARERGIRVVFYQSESDSRQAEAFAAEIGGRAVELSPLHENYIENLEIMAAAIAAGGEE